LRAYWLAKQVLAANDEEALAAAIPTDSDKPHDSKKFQEHSTLLESLALLLSKVEDSKVMHRQTCDKVIRGEYLRRKFIKELDGQEEELSMPLWVLFGYWEHSKFLFIYKNIEAEQAMEVMVIPHMVEVSMEESNKNSFQILNIPSQSNLIWFTTTDTARDEWCYLLESS